MSKTFILVVLVSLLVSALSTQQSSLTEDSQALGYNLESEDQVEKVADQQIQQHYGSFNYPVIEQQADVKGQLMPAISHMQKKDTPAKYMDIELYFRLLDREAAVMLFLGYGREDERESDHIGAEYAFMQKYKPADRAQLFLTIERFYAQSGLSIPSRYSTHPDPAEMAISIPKLAELWSANSHEQTIVNTDQKLGTLNNIIYADNPGDGFTRNGSFYHPKMKSQFSYPEKRQTINQQSLEAIFNNSDYTVISFLMLPIRPVGTQGAVQTESETQLKFYLCSIRYDRMICQFINFTPGINYGTYGSPFKERTNGFRYPTDSALLNVQPKRLPSVKTNRPDTNRFFRLPNSDSHTKTIEPEYLAMMNQAALNDRIESCTWTKIQR